MFRSDKVWADESMRFGLTGGLYLLAAVQVPDADVDEVRRALRTMTMRGQKKIRWNGESSRRRARLSSFLAALDIQAVVVAGAPADPKRQERARAQCLEHLVLHLSTGSSRHIVMERRQARLDARDLRLVERLRGGQQIRPDLRVEVADPREEPMLWIADFVAGIAGDALTGLERSSTGLLVSGWDLRSISLR